MSTDPMEKSRPLTVGGGTNRTQQPNWTINKPVAELEKFAGKIVARASVVGMAAADRILLETWIKEQKNWQLARYLTISPIQAPHLVQGLVDSDIRIADLAATSTENWQELPMPVLESRYARRFRSPRRWPADGENRSRREV